MRMVRTKIGKTKRFVRQANKFIVGQARNLKNIFISSKGNIDEEEEEEEIEE